MHEYGYKSHYYPLTPWEQELLYGMPNPTLNSVENGVNDRIREIEDEVSAAHRMIGEAFCAGDTDLAQSWAVSVNEKQARLNELKNVLNMIGG